GLAALVVQRIEHLTPNETMQVRFLPRAPRYVVYSKNMPSSVPELEELERMLEETRKLAADNNRLLREMRRNALLGFFARIVVWLIVLGVPLFFLSSYLGPILEALS